MGVLNITPDSFSDGGKFIDPQKATDHALKMEAEGADIIDIGGESTRPGARAVSVEEEIDRVIPVIEFIRRHSDIPISIDTQKSFVAEAALQSGADIINDVSALSTDPRVGEVTARYHAPIILMHMQGDPRSMQNDPRYDNVVPEIKTYLANQAELALSLGIKDIILDPGIGFGKTVEHNLTILRELKDFTTLGYPLMVGVSRKSFIGKILGGDVDDRLEGTAAAVAFSILKGANIIRVHDVRFMKRIAVMVDTLSGMA